MKRFVVFSLWLSLGLWGCSQPPRTAEIDAGQLKTMMETEQVLVVFPLSSIEFDDLHIRGSVNIPMSRIPEALPEDKDQKIAFYCLGRECTAAVNATKKAVRSGYTQVYTFRDGLPGWVAAGYPTETVEALPKLDVPRVTSDELLSLLQGGEDVVLLDIRIAVEAKKFWLHHPGWTNITLNQLPQRLAELPRDRKIVVFDLIGKRSGVAARYLLGKGFGQVVELEGGMKEWKEKRLPLDFAG